MERRGGGGGGRDADAAVKNGDSEPRRRRLILRETELRAGSNPNISRAIPMSIPRSQAQPSGLSVPDNFYGTPKPPAEPGALLLNVTDQLLPGARPTSEGKRKRNKSVSNMEKASIEPPEEEEEERPIVNGNGVLVTPGQSPGAGEGTQRSTPCCYGNRLLATEAAGFTCKCSRGVWCHTVNCERQSRRGRRRRRPEGVSHDSLVNIQRFPLVNEP